MVAKVALLHPVDPFHDLNLGDRIGYAPQELRVDVGAGYRVYYAQAGARVVLLLAGGGKGSQDADIERAIRHWQDWQRRTE